MAQLAVYPVLSFEKLAPYIDASGDCWEWTGGIDFKGYGFLAVQIDGKSRNRRAHRLVWVALCGPIIGNLPLDHLCRVHRCVNPDHLEPVTHRTNILRGYGRTALNAKKTHCNYGHSNWVPAGRGNDRRCADCDREHKLRTRANADRAIAARLAERSKQAYQYGPTKTGAYLHIVQKTVDGCTLGWCGIALLWAHPDRQPPGCPTSLCVHCLKQVPMHATAS